MYRSKYGRVYRQSPAHTDASNSSFDENSLDGAASDDDSKDRDYKPPDGLVFSDDEDFLVDVESESEDDRLRSSFPKDTRRKNIVPGGPQPPDLLTYPESEREKVWNDYVVKRRKFTDEARKTRMKNTKSISLSSSSSTSFCGWQNEQLRPMSEVETNRLEMGHTLNSKDVLQLRIAEEANLRGICTRTQRSDFSNLVIVGIDFYVKASLYENDGWRVHDAICCEGDDMLQIPPKDRIDITMANKKGFLRIPIGSKLIVATIKDAVADNPGITYQSI